MCSPHRWNNADHEFSGTSHPDGPLEENAKPLAAQPNTPGSDARPAANDPPEGTARAWGHFGLVYENLVPGAVCIPCTIRERGGNRDGTLLEDKEAQVFADMNPLAKLLHHNFNALDLMKGMPDLYSPLVEIGIPPDLCRGGVEVQYRKNYTATEHGTHDLANTETTHDFFLDGLPHNRKGPYMEHLCDKNPAIQSVADFGTNVHLRLNAMLPEIQSPNLANIQTSSTMSSAGISSSTILVVTSRKSLRCSHSSSA